MKNYVVLFIIFILLGYSCKNKQNDENKDIVETISINTRNAHLEYDIASLIDTSYFEIIPLETNDNCLIAEINDIYFANNKIVIFDKRALGAYIFNRDGTYHAKVRAVGQGPGEYPDWVNDIHASENHISVLTPPGIMQYNYDGKYVRTISLENRWGRNIFTFDDINYFLVNDWSMTMDLGYSIFFHLFYFDTSQNKIISYLPFSKTDIDNQRGWTIDKYYNLYNNKALINISSIDTLYSLTPEGEISPQYKIDILYNKLPDDLRKGHGRTALLSAQKNDYIIGVLNVAETSRYLFLKLNDGYHVIYDKQEKQTVTIANLFRISSFWNFGISFIKHSFESDYIVYYIEGYNAFNAKNEIETEKVNKRWTLGDGNNEFEKKLFKVLENVKEAEYNAPQNLDHTFK